MIFKVIARSRDVTWHVLRRSNLNCHSERSEEYSLLGHILRVALGWHIFYHLITLLSYELLYKLCFRPKSNTQKRTLNFGIQSNYYQTHIIKIWMRSRRNRQSKFASQDCKQTLPTNIRQIDIYFWSAFWFCLFTRSS